MLEVMDPKERIRVYFDADEELRQALKQVALDTGKSVSAIIEEILRREFPAEIKEARRKLQERAKKSRSDT